MDIVRVFRIVEYVGPRRMVELIVENSVHGTKRLCGPASNVTIRAATLGTYPEILEREEDKENKECQEKASS